MIAVNQVSQVSPVVAPFPPPTTSLSPAGWSYRDVATRDIATDDAARHDHRHMNYVDIVDDIHSANDARISTTTTSTSTTITATTIITIRYYHR